MRFAHLLSRVTDTPWLITEGALQNICGLIEARINSAPFTADASVFKADAGAPLRGRQGDAVIPLQGVIGKRLSSMEMACGGCDIDSFLSAYDAANASPLVSRIVFDVSSPGGTVSGVPEAAQHIYDTKTKPVLAVSDTLIGSAAYYIAAACDEIVVTPTAQVGSIGVASAVREATGAKDPNASTRLRVFRSGEHKLMGVDAPLTDAQAAIMQERADFLGAMFRDFVSMARPGVQAGTMQGLTYFGDAGVKNHLADRVVPNLRDAIG